MMHPKDYTGRLQQETGVTTLFVTLDKTVDPVAIGPVALHCDEREAFFLDEAFGNGRAPGVVFVRAMGGFAQHHDRPLANVFQQGVEILRSV